MLDAGRKSGWDEGEMIKACNQKQRPVPWMVVRWAEPLNWLMGARVFSFHRPVDFNFNLTSTTGTSEVDGRVSQDDDFSQLEAS